MKQFDELNEVINTLLAPNGCPWDRAQTLASLRTTLLEESYEVIDAIDRNHNEEILEELGDLFFNALFLCKVGEREGRFAVADVVAHVTAKLIRRHPHVFAREEVHASIESAEHGRAQWEKVKAQEKQHHTSALDTLPNSLPALLRAQKLLRKLRAHHLSLGPLQDLSEEEKRGEALWMLIQQIEEQGEHPEQALRKYMRHIEEAFRQHEAEHRKK